MLASVLSNLLQPLLPRTHHLHLAGTLKEEYNSASDETSGNLPNSISAKSKRIMKREKAKQRTQARTPKITEETLYGGEIPEKYIPKAYYDPKLDEKAKRKMLQMVRNRISAQNSRDRKKQHTQLIEEKNNELSQENFSLKNKVNEQDELIKALQKENEELRNGLVSALGTKATHHLQNDVLQNDFLSSDHFRHSDNETQNTGESPALSGTTSPVLRRSFRTGGFMKYSLALATIFAVLTFTGVNPSAENATLSALSGTPQQQQLANFQPPQPKSITFNDPI